MVKLYGINTIVPGVGSLKTLLFWCPCGVNCAVGSENHVNKKVWKIILGKVYGNCGMKKLC